MKQKLIFLITAFVMGISQIGFLPDAAAQVTLVRKITFPVLGGASYSDDFGDPRSGGRSHEGNDIMGKKMQPLLAAVNGTISSLTSTQASWGYSLTIVDRDGYEYNYLHINNDNPGTDDGLGGYNNAFAPGIQRGSKVIAGQVIAFLGDSGNAESTGAHLHFEIRNNDTNEPINPYLSLKQSTVVFQPIINPNANATVVPTPRPSRTAQASPTPSIVKTTPTPTPTPTPTSIIRTANGTPAEIYPYEEFTGGVSLTSGNVDKDADPEFITSTAFNGGGRSFINIYDTDGTLINKFFAYGELFRGGVDVTSADVDGDGIAEIITAAGPGGGPHVKIFKVNGTLVSEFFAYSSNFRGGVYVSAADVDGDGQAEIITGPGSGGGPHVRIFDKFGKVSNEFFAYSSAFLGGVDVAAFSADSTAPGGFVTAPGPGGGPHIKVYDKAIKLVEEFFAYDSDFSNGVRIAAGNLMKTKVGIEIVAVPASNFKPTLKVFETDGTLIDSTTAGFESSFIGGYDVAIVGTEAFIASGSGRKASVRKVTGL